MSRVAAVLQTVTLAIAVLAAGCNPSRTLKGFDCLSPGGEIFATYLTVYDTGALGDHFYYLIVHSTNEPLQLSDTVFEFKHHTYLWVEWVSDTHLIVRHPPGATIRRKLDRWIEGKHTIKITFEALPSRELAYVPPGQCFWIFGDPEFQKRSRAVSVSQARSGDGRCPTIPDWRAHRR